MVIHTLPMTIIYLPNSSRRVRQCCLHAGCMFFLIAIVLTLIVVDAMDGSADATAAGNSIKMPKVRTTVEVDAEKAAKEAEHDSIPDSSSSSSEKIQTPEEENKPEEQPINPEGDDDWGSFYDPNNVFCGKYDCYKILGFDFETWGSNPPSLKDITKSYRALSRKWHPDKNKAKGAREKFVVSNII